MKRLTHIKLVASSLILFIVVIGISAAFSLANVEKPYAEAIIARYEYIAINLQTRMEKLFAEQTAIVSESRAQEALNHAVQVFNDKLPRSDLLLPPVSARETTERVHTMLISPEGEVLLSSNPSLRDTSLPAAVLSEDGTPIAEPSLLTRSKYVKYGTNYYVRLPVSNAANDLLGYAVVRLPVLLVSPSPASALEKNVRTVALVLLASGICLAIFMVFAIREGGMGARAGKSKFIIAITCLVFVTQILLFTLISAAFYMDLVGLSSERVDLQAKVSKQYMERLLARGTRLERSPEVREHLDAVMAAYPELAHTTIATTHGLPLFTVRSNAQQGASDGFFMRAFQDMFTKLNTRSSHRMRYPLLQDRERFTSVLAIGLSSSYFLHKVLAVTANGFTVIAISILIFIELLILQRLFVESATPTVRESPTNSFGYMRPAIFIFLFGVDSSLSFLPLHMENLYVPMFGLSKEFIIGLPITAEFLCVGFFILVSGAWLDRRGWREPFLGGLALACLGSVYSAVAPDALQFILSRAIVGCGFGLALMASQGFVIAHSDGRSKAQGLAHMFAGLYAGSICGGAAGAMLAEHYGYTVVFLMGSAIIVLAIAYTYWFLPSPQAGAIVTADKPAQKFKASELREFLLDRNVLSLVFFSSLPAAVAVVGFLNYFSPIYLHRSGASESTIGQVLIIYGACLILAGPTIGRYVDASEDKKSWIFFGCLLGSASFLVFGVIDGVIAAVLAILLLGLSSSFVLSTQTAFALQLSVTQELGQGKAIAIFRSTSRAGQALGPLVFATMIGAIGMREGIVVLGVCYLVMALLFALITQKDKQVLVKDDA